MPTNQNNINIGYIKKLPAYYEVGSQVFATANPNASITFDLNQGLEDFASATRSFGQRLKIHHFAFDFEFSYQTVPNAPPDTNILFNNILCLLQLKTSVPLIPDYLYQEATTMDIVHLEQPIVNPSCSDLLTELTDGTSPLPAIYGSHNFTTNDIDDYGFSVLLNGKPFGSTQDTYNCASKVFALANQGVAGQEINIRYQVAMPCCNFSNNSKMDTTLADTMPAEIFTSPSGKALFTINYVDGSKTLNNTLGITNGAGAQEFVKNLVLTIKLYAYCLFEEDTDPYCHGVTWKSTAMAMKNTGDTVKPDYYRLGYVGLPPANTYSDGVCTFLQSRPFDFSALPVSPFSTNARVNWNLDGKNLWPSTDRNYARALFQDWNAGNRVGSHPRLYADMERQINVFCSPASTLGAPNIPRLPGFVTTRGILSFCPIIPLFYSIPGRNAFAPGFIQMPGTDCSPQVTLQKWTLSNDMVQAFRSILLSGSENALKQRETIRRYCIYGSSARSGVSSGQWTPTLDSFVSRRSSLYSLLVPEFCASAR